jgi:endonuclease YncB( thermonuclease family)
LSRSSYVAAVLFTLLTALSVLPTPNSIDAQAAPLVRVVHVIDGDTIEVCCIGGKQEKVRYIGIDSPETNHPTKGMEPFGREQRRPTPGW